MTTTGSSPSLLNQADQTLARLVDEFSKKLERGELVDLQQYAAQYPDYADPLRRLLPAIQSLADLGCSITDSTPSSIARTDEQRLTAGVLGDFRIIREIGRGGMGVVYEAEQISMQRRVALKVLPFAAVLDDKQIRRFKNEALAAGQLQHTNIVPVYSVGCERGVHFYAMQFIDGQTLGEVIRELRRAASPVMIEDRGLRIEDRATVAAADGLPPFSILHPRSSTASTSPFAALSTDLSTNPKEFFRSVARLGVQAAEALEHAHESGVIHRDIKPSNLLLDKKGNLWITDFGLAHFQTDTNLTMTGDLIGTLRYMSPEQALAKRVIIDHRTDIYSLGVTLYELLTLQPAFGGEDRQELLRQIAFDEPQPLRRINDRIPPELETIVLKATAKNPTERYASAQELAEDLDRLLRDEPIKARRPTLVQRARKWTRRHQPLVWSAAVCVLFAITAIAVSVGWFAGDRATRWEAVERQVALALQEATQLMQQAKWPEALAWLERADGLLAGGGSSDEVRGRVTDLRNDLDLVRKLEEVRIEVAANLDIHMSVAETNAHYAKVFRDSGLDLEDDNVVERIRHSAVQSQLIAAIDAWADLVRDDTTSKRLLSIVRAADRDELCRNLRDAMEHGNHEFLGKLAASAETTFIPPQLVIFAAHEMFELGQADEAMSLLRFGQQRNPNDFWINLELAIHLHNREPHEWGEMVQFSRVALALRPESSAVWNLVGDALRHAGKLDEAVITMEMAVRLNPDSFESRVTLGNVLLDKGLLDQAIAEFREATRLEPDSFVTHGNLGMALRRKGLVDEAVAECREAIRLKPDHARSHATIGEALLANEDFDGAITVFREAIRLKPEYAPAFCGLCEAFRRKGAFGDALIAGQEAVRLEPNIAESHHTLGLVFYDQGLLDQAIIEFRDAIRLKPVFVGAHNNLGNALKATGEVKAAISEYHKAIELKPDFAAAHTNLGVALHLKRGTGSSHCRATEGDRTEAGPC